MDAKTRNAFKKLLTEQMTSLIKEASQTVEDMSSRTDREVPPDEVDRASEDHERNFLLRIRDRERNLIAKIKQALDRLEKGTFGICESCGGKISVPRLKARPVTTLCIDCKAESEEKEKSNL